VTLFAHVLAELGFSFRILGARVHAGATLAVPPRTHALVLLDLEGRTWFADPGFGGLGPRGVLPFVEGQPVRTGDSAHRLVRREQRWFLQNEHEGAFVDLHSFTLDTFETIDLEVANHYTATHPRSRFKNALVVQRHVDRGRVTLRDRELVVREDGKVERQVVRDRRELLEVLRDRFALDVPEVASAALPSY
jgi:N-hydroxyarylamine O-acetyltransferase